MRSIKGRRGKRAGMAALAGVVAVLGMPTVAGATTVVVHPGNTAGWTASVVGGGAGSYVEGPGAPPLGSGSFSQDVAASADRHRIETAAFNGTPLADLTELKYSTYVEQNQGGQAAALRLRVDTDGNGSTDDTLVMEPVYQHGAYPMVPGATPVPNQCPGIPNCVAVGSWQHWNALTAGWWSVNAGTVGPPLDTIPHYLATHPGTLLATDAPAVGLQAGNGWQGYVGSFDALRVKVNSTLSVFDFEGGLPSVVIVTPFQMGPWDTAALNGGAGSFISGPGSPPFGLGSFRQSTPVAGDRHFLRSDELNGRALEDIHALGYWTYVTGAVPRAAGMQLYLDLNGNGVYEGSTVDDFLVFEPEYQTGGFGMAAGAGSVPNQCAGIPGCVASNTWQYWDADAGAWWPRSYGNSGPPDLETLASYAAKNPGATVITLGGEGNNGLLLATGTSSGIGWNGFQGSVDGVQVDSTIYDFEPANLTVDCDAITDDVGAVQAAVNAAPDGSTVKLRGTCDFSLAADHGGDITSIVNTGVLIRPGTPVNGLTITSDGAPQSATVVGSGRQAAFTVAPGNSNVTIEGLTFANLGRAVVAINTNGTTVGATGGLPSPNANRIIGGATMDTAILGLALDRNPGLGAPSGTVELNYGVGGSSSASFSGQGTAKLEDFTVRGNYISYDPPGAEDGVNQIVAIGVRQRFQNVVDGVLIKENAVGMFASEFPTTNMTGVQIHSLNSVAPVGTIDPTDYLIRNVTIDGNNLGRLEELGMAADLHATGRLGILVMGASNFTITDNGVRVRMSPTGIPMPGGGIVVSDSGFGSIGPGNSSIVLTDPSTMLSDLGAYGVVEDLVVAFGGASKAQVTTSVVLTGNRIGPVMGGVPAFAQRGLVVLGARNVVAYANDFVNTSASAVNLGVEVLGPGSDANPGPHALPANVTGSVICQNNLDGTTDDVSEVTATDATGNAFPGGASVPVDNVACVPTLGLAPATLNAASGNLVAVGDAWPNRPVTLTLTDGTAPDVVLGGTAGADGSYSIQVPPASWGTLSDGTLTGTVTTSAVLAPVSATSPQATVFKDTGLPAIPVILSPPDGAVLPTSYTVSGGADPSTLVTLLDGGSPVGSVTSSATGAWSVALSGVAGGAHTYTAVATDASANDSPPSAPVTVTVDPTIPLPPAILFPSEGETVPTETIAVSGTKPAGTSVTLKKGAATLGTYPADPGTTWSITAFFAPGTHQVSAFATNGVGTSSPPSPLRTFFVKVDFDAPVEPTIEDPAEDSLNPRLVAIGGFAEVGMRVSVYEGSALVGRATADAVGRWEMTAGFPTGEHTLIATATDGAGNTSGPSDPRTFLVDGDRPTVDFTTDNYTPFLMSAPVIEGNATDNAGVASVLARFYDSFGALIGTASATLASPGGTSTTWQVAAPSGAFLNFSVQVNSYDAVGNVSASAQRTFFAVG